MELRIKSEINGAECEYTGEIATHLIKIGNESSETGWMSRAALESALRILNSLEAPHVAPTIQQPPSSPGYTKTVSHPTRDTRTEILMESLDIACAELKSKDAEGKGVSELKIFDIVQRFRDRFPKKTDMFPVLNHHFGLQKNRFDILVARPVEKLQMED